jgi:hypothetical protein
MQKTLKYLFLSLILIGAIHVRASIIDGTINSSNHTAQVCENIACSVTATSPVNFGYFTNSTSSNVHVLDTELTGYIWGSSFGWVVLNCSNTTSGCSSTNGNFKVANNYNGTLSGYAWGDSAGWINFGPYSGSATSPIAINSSGQFTGYAWSENFGWIKFDCSDSNYCVQTDWRPRNTRPQCSDGLDNDSDTLIDSADRGCHTDGNAANLASYDPTDNQEFTPTGGTTSTGGPGTTTTTSTTGPGTTTTTSTTGPGTTSTSTDGTGPGTSTTDGTGPGTTDTTSTDGTTDGTTDTTSTSTDGTGPGTSDSTSTSTTSTSSSTGTSGGGSGGGTGGFIDEVPLPPIVKQAIKDAITKTADVINTKTGDAVSKTVATAGAISGISMSIATAIFANPLTFSELFLIPLRLWSLLLAALGLKKRNRPWGTVYDSVTKQPLDPAYVVLQDMQGNEVATSITDIDGRYGFLVPAGMYRMIAHKTNYEFPSKNLLGKTGDELYQDLYFNEVLEITEGGVITKNIPLDPLNFDWNEFAKKEQGLMKFYSHRDVWFARISNILFWFGFTITTIAVIATPQTYNIITFAVYIVLLGLKRTVLKPRPFGTLKRRDGTPLSFAIMRIYTVSGDREVAHKIADKTGKYYALIPNGMYYVKVEQKNPDASYTPVYTSTPIEVKNGYINKAFEI